MKNSEVQTLFVCGCCKRSLPASAFYINKKTGLPGNYCKECRKTVSLPLKPYTRSSRMLLQKPRIL